jgi:hypothetical protein
MYLVLINVNAACARNTRSIVDNLNRRRHRLFLAFLCACANLCAPPPLSLTLSLPHGSARRLTNPRVFLRSLPHLPLVPSSTDARGRSTEWPEMGMIHRGVALCAAVLIAVLGFAAAGFISS